MTRARYFLLALLFILLVSGCAHTDERTCSLNPDEAAVISVNGDVKIFTGSEEKKAEEGTIVKAGDRITSAAGSSAEIAYDEACKNLTRLDENTEVAIETVSPTRLDMAMGKLFADLEALKKDEPFEVRTPTCAAAVRGTEFDVSIKDGESEVRSFQNEVTVYGIDKEGKLFDGRPLKAGGKIGVRRFGKPGNVFKMQKGEWKEGRNSAKMIRGRAVRFMQRSGGRPSFSRGRRKGNQGLFGIFKRGGQQQTQGRGLLGKASQQKNQGLGPNRKSGAAPRSRLRRNK